jgi:hypothetical protein
MNTYALIALVVALWCFGACVTAFVLGRLIAFGTQPVAATLERSLRLCTDEEQLTTARRTPWPSHRSEGVHTAPTPTFVR